MKLKISNEELRKFLDIDSPDFPKYTTSILNLANQFAHRAQGRKLLASLATLSRNFLEEACRNGKNGMLRKIQMQL